MRRKLFGLLGCLTAFAIAAVCASPDALGQGYGKKGTFSGGTVYVSTNDGPPPSYYQSLGMFGQFPQSISKTDFLCMDYMHVDCVTSPVQETQPQIGNERVEWEAYCYLDRQIDPYQNTWEELGGAWVTFNNGCSVNAARFPHNRTDANAVGTYRVRFAHIKLKLTGFNTQVDAGNLYRSFSVYNDN